MRRAETAWRGCDFCGLPVYGQFDSDESCYCCYGCRFAASVAAADGDEGRARWEMTRLGVAIFFSMNVMVFTLLLWSQSAAPADRLAGVWYDLARYACLLFTIPVVMLLGGPLCEDALAELRRGRASLSLLLCAGVAAALAHSAWSLLAGGGHVYFEVASTILVAVTLGRWLEATGKLKTTAALRGLQQLLPDTVRLVTVEGERLVSITQLAAGDQFHVLPGERIAADGEIVRYEAAIDEQVATGESLPVVRRPGEQVISGTLVLDGPLIIRAVAPAGEGMLARMIEAVTRAATDRTRYERLAESISRWFLPSIAVMAIGTFAIHAWQGHPSGGLLSALSVIVIACPCALGLATPMAVWAAVGRAAQAGVLLRDGDALSALAAAKTVCFDKTGTLTSGEASVVGFRHEPGLDEAALLRVAWALSRSSNHPLAAAVGRFTHARLVWPPAAVHDVIVRAGRGIVGRNDELAATAFLGSRAWMMECGQRVPRDLVPPSNSRGDCTAETLMAWGGVVRARFEIQEAVRPAVQGTIASLRALGMECIILTGDRSPRARALADQLGVRYQAELLPEAKLDAIRTQQKKGPVIMVGDGINDAPALAVADVGVALGSGTDISRDSARACLLGNDLSRLPWLVRLARQTERTIRWNLAWAFGYNVAGIGLAATGWLHPVVAAIAMGVSSLLVVANSLSLAQFEIDQPAWEAHP